jgi:hypothetical protein
MASLVPQRMCMRQAENFEIFVVSTVLRVIGVPALREPRGSKEPLVVLN